MVQRITRGRLKESVVGKAKLIPKVVAMDKEDLDKSWCEAGFQLSGQPRTRICIDKGSGWRGKREEG